MIKKTLQILLAGLITPIVFTLYIISMVGSLADKLSDFVIENTIDKLDN
jgi:uncharacterized membrane protein